MEHRVVALLARERQVRMYGHPHPHHRLLEVDLEHLVDQQTARPVGAIGDEPGVEGHAQSIPDVPRRSLSVGVPDHVVLRACIDLVGLHGRVEARGPHAMRENDVHDGREGERGGTAGQGAAGVAGGRGPGVRDPEADARRPRVARGGAPAHASQRHLEIGQGGRSTNSPPPGSMVLTTTVPLSKNG